MSFCHSTARRVASGALVATQLAGFAASDLEAAMAPQYERVQELALVMSAVNEAAIKLFAHGPIDRIERADDGTYRFWARGCFVPARLEPLPADDTPPQPGTPTGYRVALGDARCD